MTADNRTITVEQLAAAGFEPDFNVCARCHHHGSRHDLNNRCLDCIEQVGPDYFVSMTRDEAWDWGLLRLFAALPSEPSEADRLLVALVRASVPPDALIGADPASKVGSGGESLKRWWFEVCGPALAAARAYIERKGLA